MPSQTNCMEKPPNIFVKHIFENQFYWIGTIFSVIKPNMSYLNSLMLKIWLVMVKSLTYIYYPTSFCAGDLFWKFSGKFDVFKIFCCRISDCRRYQAPPMGALRYMITDTALHSNGSIKNTFCNIDKYTLQWGQIYILQLIQSQTMGLIYNRL